FIPLNSMKGLAAKFFSSRPAPPLPATMLQSQVETGIGYSIPSRWMVATPLAVLVMFVGGAGVYLRIRGRLEWLGWAGPAMALAVSGGLILLCRQHRNSIPPTVSSIQFVQPLPGTDDIRVERIAGLYA